jgi:hypothetical protein
VEKGVKSAIIRFWDEAADDENYSFEMLDNDNQIVSADLPVKTT